MKPTCLESWRSLMNALGAPENGDVRSELLAAYAQPHRHYHTLRHLDDCLERFEEARSLARFPAEVEIALWFHDSVYDPASSENELRSARWADCFLRSSGVDDARRERVFQLILATKHDVERPTDGDASLVVDVDLSILGRTPVEYDVYEAAIRREYEWVPRPVYQVKRAEVLDSFLKRPAIYVNEWFRERFERAARHNLQRAIDRLGKQGG